MAASASRAPPLLVPYRAIGLVTDGVPFAVAKQGTETFVTTAVGRSFSIYSEQKLRLVFAGPQLQRPVTALCSTGELTIVASGSEVYVYRRAECTLTCTGEHTAPIRHLLVLGDTLLTICESGVLTVWSLTDGEVLRRLHAGFAPSAIVHPATYLNKVLLAAPDGRMKLLNLRTGTSVYEFAGWGSAVLCLEQSPALDVIGIGHADGRLCLHNLKADRTVLSLAHEEGDAVTGLAFRTDGEPIVVSASARGALHVWHLQRRARLTSLPDVHSGGIGALHFVRGQPMLLTMGASDNALRVWAFDGADGGARLLRSRSGHSAPPCAVRFHADSLLAGGGPAGQAYLLSGGADRTLRQSSIWSSQQDAEFSQRREEKKHSMHVHESEARRLPPLLDLATSQVRERDWSNILTCHAGCRQAYTWQSTRRALGPHTLQLASAANVTAVAISACGNFGYLGGATGAIEKFNLQSGTRRATAPTASLHEGSVRGLAAEPLSRAVFSGGADGTIRSWQPSDLKPLSTLQAGAPVALLRHHRDSILLAAACDDLCVRVFDVVLGRLVRQLSGHKNTISDLAWSADGRWLLSTSLDATIRVTDVPSGVCIGWYAVEDPATSIAVSPQGEYIATAHAATTALCVWANRSFFESALPTPAGERPQKLEMPVASGGGDDADDDDEEASDDGTDDGGESDESDEGDAEADEERRAAQLLQEQDADQLSGCLTLSALPPSHARTVVHLDAIQERNRPVQPVQAPKSAPFFLPTLPGVTREFDPSGGVAAADAATDATASALVADAAGAEAGEGGGALAGNADDDDEWAAAAAAAGMGDDADDGIDGEGAGDEEGGVSKRARHSRMLASHGRSSLSKLQSLLRSAAAPTSGEAATVAADSGAPAGATTDDGPQLTGAQAAVLAHILSLSPSALDLELRSVGSGVSTAVELAADLCAALDFFTAALTAGRGYEIVQAALCVFLRIHQATLMETRSTAPALQRLRDAQQGSWGELRDALHGNLCMLSFLCRTQS